MKKAKSIAIVALLAFVIMLAAFVVTIKDKVPNNIFSYLDIGTYKVPSSVVEVNSSNKFGQSFVSNFDNLFMMSVFIPKQDLDREGELIFHLKHNKKDGDDIVTLRWNLNQIKFRKNNFYVIPPDRESTSQGFHFHFQFPPMRHQEHIRV